MTTDAAIRSGLADSLYAIPGLTPYTHVPNRINAPAGIVRRAVTRFDSTMARGADDFEYGIILAAPFADAAIGQDTMSPYLDTDGEYSVKAAVEADPTLGGVVHFARVREAGEETLREFAGVTYLTVEFIVEVTA